MDQQDIDEQERAAREREKDQRLRELVNKIDFGMAVQTFLEGPVGTRLIADSEAELTGLREELCALDIETAHGLKRWKELCQQIGIIEHWQSWFAAYIHEGSEAETEFHEGETPLV